MSREVCGICWCPYDDDTGACTCEPEPKKQHMTALRTAAQQALEALVSENSLSAVAMQQRMDAITALKDALAEPTTEDSSEVEPVIDGYPIWSGIPPKAP